MELRLKAFIEEHRDDWQAQLESIGAVIKPYEDNLYLFSYNDWAADWENHYDVLSECRGTVYYINDTEVVPVAMGLKKFFNYNEPRNRASIDFSNSVIYDKMDGTCILFWHWNNQWYISTLGCIGGENMLPCGATVAELVEDALGMPWQHYCHLYLFRGYTHVCELIHPRNRIVVSYTNEHKGLYYIMSRHTTTWNEVVLHTPANMRTIGLHSYATLDECLNIINTMGEDKEGYVVMDTITHERVKVKSPTYFALHRLRGNGLLNDRIFLELLERGILDDYMSQFPDMREQCEKYLVKYNHMRAQADIVWTILRDVDNGKELSEKMKDISSYIRSYVFARHNYKYHSYDEWFNSIHMTTRLNIMKGEE